jgi:murein DD-endopeptidase MepM/ murein hydrolase activator NlpD
MRISVLAALMIVTTVLLSACEQQQVAQVEDRGQNFYGRLADRVSQHTYQAAAVDSVSVTDITSTSHSQNSMSFSSTPSAPFARVSMTAPAPAATSSYSNTPAPFQRASDYKLAQPVAAQPASMAAPVEQFSLQQQPSAPMTVAATTGDWAWPVEGQVTQKFGQQSVGISNEGIVIAAKEGAPIRAASAGEVVYVGDDQKIYGNIAIIRHASGQLTSYAHAQEILVSKGDKVLQGDVLGYVGKTGSAKAPQLHFAMREGDKSIDPLSKLPQHFANR